MVYGFLLIGSALVGAIYWMTTICQEQGAMWSPGGGIVKPEPWLQTNYGGYSGWAPGDTQYSDWLPGAYLNLFTTTRRTTTRRRPTTTKRKRRPITFPSRLPTQLPEIISPSSEEVVEEVVETQLTSVESTPPEAEEAAIPPSDTEPGFDPNRIPPIHGAPPVATEAPPDEWGGLEAEANDYDEYNRPQQQWPPPLWRSNDQNEEAYEERPRDIANTQPPVKLPVGGWGYDYEN